MKNGKSKSINKTPKQKDDRADISAKKKNSRTDNDTSQVRLKSSLKDKSKIKDRDVSNHQEKDQLSNHNSQY